MHVYVTSIVLGGFDTLILTAGVSALQPLMSVAGVDMSAPDIVGSQASPEGIQHAVNAATAAVNGNFIGPYIAAITFVRTPYILLRNTLTRHLRRSPNSRILHHLRRFFYCRPQQQRFPPRHARSMRPRSLRRCSSTNRYPSNILQSPSHCSSQEPSKVISALPQSTILLVFPDPQFTKLTQTNTA